MFLYAFGYITNLIDYFIAQRFSQIGAINALRQTSLGREGSPDTGRVKATQVHHKKESNHISMRWPFFRRLDYSKIRVRTYQINFRGLRPFCSVQGDKVMD